MCLIVIGKLEHIKKLDLDKAWQTNPHGVGIVIPSNKPDMIKGIMKYKQFDSLLGKLDDSLTIAIHFRMATHGEISPRNTHPFKINKDSYLMHNGMLQGLGSAGTKGLSDTAHLACILQRIKAADRTLLLESLPGKYALIDGNTIHSIGAFDTLDNDIEVSNTYWMPSKIRTYSGSANSIDYSDYWKPKGSAWEMD